MLLLLGPANLQAANRLVSTAPLGVPEQPEQRELKFF
jgi:hypothetical protein